MRLEIALIALLITTSFQKITILSPKLLADEFNNTPINATLSNFGKINYGYNLVGKLHWDSKNIFNDFACGDMSNFTHPPSNITEVDSSPIVMVDRSECTFVKKVRNIENIGGKIALIVDNIENEDVKYIIMVDDGTGGDLTIPALMISYKDGQRIKDFYLKNRNTEGIFDGITMKINYEIARKSVVELKIFFSSEMTEMYYFLTKISKFILELKDKIDFAPYYISDTHPLYNEKNPVNIENCISGGEFCVSGNIPNIEDNRLILLENIRQKCIFQLQYNKYFDYLNAFYTNCLKQNNFNFNKNCAVESMESAKIDPDQINNCLTSSFDDYSKFTTSHNKLLKKDIEQKKQSGAFLLPFSILINNRQFRGNLKFENVMEAVCAGYLKRPDLCQEEKFYNEVDSGISTGLIILLLAIFVVFNFLIYLTCRRYISRNIMERLENTDINHRINTVVTSYLSLKEHK